MSPIAFLSAFTAVPLCSPAAPLVSRRSRLPLAPQRSVRRVAFAAAAPQPSQEPAPIQSQQVQQSQSQSQSQSQPAQHHHQSQPQGRTRRRIAVIATTPQPQETKEIVIDLDTVRKGVFGFKAKAYWDGMGVLPLFFAGFGLTALAIKMLKLKGGEMRGGQAAVNKLTVPKTAITSEEEEAELHVYKCGGCGYEIYPARGREFKFFPDSFKCPLCGTPKSEFWDLNDPDDPRNQEPDDDDDDDDDGDETDGTTEAGESEDTHPTTPEASAPDGSLQSPDPGSSAPEGTTNPSP